MTVRSTVLIKPKKINLAEPYNRNLVSQADDLHAIVIRFNSLLLHAVLGGEYRC